MNDYVGTRPVGADHRFDIAALEVWLRAYVDGYQGPARVEQFKGGQSNPTFKITTPAQSYVMRAKPGPAARLLPSAHAIEREFRVMGSLAPTDVPVARMFAICENESIIGRAFFIMEYVEGRVFWDHALSGLAPAQRKPVYDEMNRVIAALHTVDYTSVGLDDYGRPGNYFARQIARWSKQYQASITVETPSMDRLMAWLPDHIPAQARDETQASIVHGDFRIDNLMFHPTEPRAVALLDWELSTIGHPLADFSYNCMAWHIAPDLFRGLGGLDVTSLGIPPEREYVRLYCARTRRSDVDAVLADWNFYLAYNLFRIAAIAQGVAKRVEIGTASSAQARATGALARPLSDLAWSFAEKARS